jgi:hypothetical protein
MKDIVAPYPNPMSNKRFGNARVFGCCGSYSLFKDLLTYLRS